jgi:CheY-like chemotaxis protein
MNSPVATSCRHTLLVISSDSANLQLMTQLIARRGDLALRTTPNGVQGMDLAATTQPQVIVLDTNHADAGAKEAFKGLKRNPLTSLIPVIAVSSDAFPAQIQAGLESGFHRYLTKPYMVSDLMDAIDDSLGYALGVGVVNHVNQFATP